VCIPPCTRFALHSRQGNLLPTRLLIPLLLFAFVYAAVTSGLASAQTAGQNVNMVSGTGWTNGDPFLERQNEPSLAVSTRNSSHLFGASNDYRSVDLPGLLGIDERGDAWLGIYKSFDGGQTWQSTLLPGFPLDGSPEGLASPIHGRQAAADPLVRAGSNGLFFLTGIAFDRGSSPLSKVFISRFIDLNNKENGDAANENGALTNLAPRDPVKYIDTRVIDAGSSTRFLDKPWVAVDIPRSHATCTINANEDGTTVTQKVAAGAIYVTYTAFTTVGTVQNSQILFRRSMDCGVTWSKPIVLSQNDDLANKPDAEGQGAVIAIDPSVPANQPAKIYVAWRVFAEPGDPDDANQIRIARSSDGGLSFDEQEPAVTFPLSCNKVPTGVGCPFDQGETGTSFRSNGYPGLTVDNVGRVYLAWSQRDKNGDGRITMTVMNRVEQCSSSRFKQIDPGAVYDDYGDAFTNLSDRGSQLMPTLNFNAGKLMLTYYDLRQDHTSGTLSPAAEPTCNPLLTPLCPIGNPFTELREFAGELLTNPLSVFTPYVDDSTLTVRRHTLDIVGSEGTPVINPWILDVPIFTHFRVSRYEYGIIPPGTDVQQAQFNAPNLPMFVQGTAPFMGDYIDVAGAPSMVADNSRSGFGWKFNSSPTTNPVFHATWTDNRDVLPPPDGVSWDKYTPPISASIGPTSKFDPTKTPPACVSGYSGMRNQNIYTSAISHGLILTSPQTAKPVLQSNGQPIPREFSLVMRNETTDSRTFQLTIPAQPASAQASFLQFSLQTTLTVNIPALSSASRPMFLTPSAGSTVLFPAFEVDAAETDGANPPLTASILFNADPTNPALANPDNAAFGSGSISSQEFYNPAILNPAILNPAILNPAILNPAILNPAILNPAILNPAILNPAILNPNFVVALNPAILNPAILNPAILNNAVANPAILNPAILNTPVSDANYTITNEGNTSATYQLQLFQSGALPASAVFQIILTKTYLTPGVSPTDGCTYGGQVNNEVVASIDNPVFVTDPTQVGNPAILNSAINNPTFSIAPGDTLQVTLRANLTIDQLANVVLPNLSPVVAAQAVNTVDVQQGITTPPITLLISTAALPSAVTGQPYSATLTALGGTPPVSADAWSLVGGSLPPGLNLSAAGIISGTPTAVGTFPFVVQVADTGTPQHIASRQFSITVAPPVAITTPALPNAAPGAQYTQVVTATGGIPPYTWTSTGTLPPGLTLSSTTGVISGIPTTAGTYTFSVMVSDSLGVFATASYTIVISTTVTQPAQITFLVQPSNAIGSQAISPAVQVQVTDVTGAPLPNNTVTMSIANLACPSATLSGTLTGTTNANGIASFANLNVDHGQRNYTLAATVANSSGISNPFNVEGYCETGSMNTARHNHILLLLPNGKVLITGGAVNANGTGALASAELYDPVAHTFTNVGPMNVARADHTVTLLPNGKVLVAGGFNDVGVVSSAELFDPSTNTFTLLTAPMTSLRAEHTATLLTNGEVLIAGGNTNTNSVATAEIFDPAAGSFTASSHTMTTVRQIHHADLLPNGQVLISGGFDNNNNPLASAEIYDPVADTFTATGSMTTARGNHASALLYNGKILVAGGLAPGDGAAVPTATAELYDPATGLFTTTGSMSIPRGHYAPTILDDGTIFIQGGASLPAGTNADVFNPATGTFRTTANFTAAQAGMRDSILPDGTVLLASGVNSQTVAVPNSEVFYPLAAPASITITTLALPNASQNQPYSQLFLEFGGVGNLTWTVASGTLPPGLALGPSGILTGTPTTSGTFTFAVTVVDSATPAKSATTGTLSLTVSGAAAPLLFPAQTLTTAVTGTAYTSSITVSGGTPPYNFLVTSGALPTGITLGANGTFTGTTTSAGSFPFGVTVTDSSAPVQTATQTFTMQAANPLAITTSTLPAGTAGTPYFANISSIGGVLPVGFAVTAGALPPGLGISLAAAPPQTATLSGTPSTAGTFTFTITAADSSSPVASASQSYTVTISPIATGIPGQIKFVGQPTATTAGNAISPAITTQVLDTAGIGVSGLTVTVGVSSGANPPILSGTLSAVTDSTGTATFSNVVVDRAGTGFNLVASLSSISTSGAVQAIAAPPSVLQGALESDTQIDLFGELAKPLPTGLAVDITTPGTHSSAAVLTSGTIASGTQINSYYIHADPVGISQNVSRLLAGEVTFPTNVLGVIVTDANLNASDGVLGVASTAYPTSGRGLRLNSPTDTIILSPDQRTVTVHLSVSNATDDVRVITAANPVSSLAPVTSASFNVAAAPGSISTVAGSTWVFPGVGVATSVPIGLDADYVYATAGIATDQSGNVYFADPVNNIVFKLSGTALSVVAGTGVEGYAGDGGPALNARLDSPTDVAFSPAGELYIADSNNSVIRKIDSAGNITTVVGNGADAEAGDGGPATSASLTYPAGIAFDAAGNLYIADFSGAIRKVNTSGIISTMSFNNIPGVFSGFGSPQLLRLGPDGSIYVPDNSLQQVLKFDSAGNVTLIAGGGSGGLYSGDGGPATSATLNSPSAVSFDTSGDIFIADEENHAIRKVNAAGIISTVAGNGSPGFGGDGGPATLALFNQPGGLAFNSSGLFIADGTNERIRRIDSTGTISTVAGNGRFKYAGDGGTATAASLDSPTSVTVDPSGNVFAADIANLVVRKLNPAGVITTYVGTGVTAPYTPPYTGDGGPATSATITYPGDVQADGASDLFLTEAGRIHKVSPSGIISTQFSGSGAGGTPLHIALDSQGNVYFVAWRNGLSQVQKLDTAGATTVVAGTGVDGFSGDGGPATSASLNTIRGIAADNAGNLFIADSANSRVRKVDTNGVITTVAGNGTFTVSGDGGPATSAGVPAPWALVLDGAGNLYIGSGNRVRKVDAAGTITTIAGGGFVGSTVNGVPALSATFNTVQGLAFDAAGDLYVGDRFDDRIRKITGVTNAPPFIFNPPSGLAVATKGLPHGSVGTAYFQSLAAVGGASPYTWSVSSGSLPAGLSLSTGGALSGTPTAAGASTFVVKVTDSGGATATQPITLTVISASSPLKFTSTQMPTAISGIAYSQALPVTGGTTPYTFALEGQIKLPAGLNFNANTGLLSGTTTAVGTYTLFVAVTDSSIPPQTALQVLTLVVAAPLAISTTTLPGGTAGTPYSANISTTGGLLPVGFTVTAGALPPGLGLTVAAAPPQTATLIGTPTTAGSFTFTITATDSSSPAASASKSYTVTIAPAVIPVANVIFLTPPQNSIEGQVLTGSPVSVRVTDANNSPIPNAAVSMGFNGTPPCADATLGGTLTQTTDATGVATFPDLTINRGQFGFALAAATGNVIGTSNAFNVEGFCDTGSLATARVDHSAVALPNGTVLVAGGATTTAETTILSSAELYNPVSHSFTSLTMQSPRAGFTMTVLQSGLVLVAGGIGTLPDCFDCVELFDPSANTFTLLRADANLMTSGRTQHTATLLPNGKVLLAGGIDPLTGNVLATAELFDPATNTFTATAAPMNAARSFHRADLLPNGQVLLTGGSGIGTNNVLASAELYDPVANTFTSTGNMATPRSSHGSGLLYTGEVLVAGGSTPGGDNEISTATAELYDPSTGTFSSTGSATRTLTGFSNSVPSLADGTSFFADGATNAQIYDPAAATFRATGYMTAIQAQPQTALLPDGTVLLAGGQDSGTGVSNGEIFYPINIIPISITTLLPTALVNVPYTQQLQEKGGVGALTWTLSSGALPAGLTLSTSGLLSGTPTTIGVSLFTVQVTDSSTPPRNTTAQFAVVVEPPLTVIQFLPTANPGVAYNQPLLVAGGASPYTFSIISGSLPAGLTLNNGIVSGTTSALGTFTFTVKATDSSTPPVSTTQAVTITVAPPIAFAPATLPGGQVGVAYSATFTATGGSGTILFGLVSGTLPVGLTLTPLGVLSGTPNTASTFTFTIAAVDSSAEPQIAQQTYTVTIAPTAAPLALGPVSLPAATVGVTYAQNFSISGGAPPYTVTQTGTLPPGLTFNGPANPPSITGTPTLIGTFANITVTAVDSLGAQAQITYSMTVNAFSAACATGSEALFNGQYVILMQGFDANGPRTLIGSITADGAGGVSSGQLDIGTDLPAGGGAAQHLNIISAQSSFSVGPDRRGCMVLTTSAGSSSYRFVLGPGGSGVSNAGRIIDFQQNGTYGSGFLHIQDPSFLATPSLSGSYAFLFSAPSSLANIGHWGMLGSFNASGGAVASGSWDYNDTQTIDGGSTWPASGLQFPSNESYAFDATGRGTIQLPSVQQFSQSSTLASANVVIYPLSSSEFFAAVLPDTNNKPLAGDVQQQVTPFSSLAFNGAGYVTGVTTAPISAGAWVGVFSANQNVWSLSSDNNFGGTYSPGSGTGSYAVDSTGRAPLASSAPTGPGPMVQVVSPNKLFFMLVDNLASTGFAHNFPGGIPPSSIVGSYAFGSAEGTMDRKVTNLAGIAVFDALGNVTFTEDQATGNTNTLTPGAVVTNTYSYTASTGRGVIPATGAPHFIFYATTQNVIYLLDVTSVDPQVQELDPLTPPALTLTPDPLQLFVGGSGTMAVILGAPAGSGGQVVTLTSSNSTVASVPASVTIAAGSQGIGFQVTAGTNPGSVDITASAAGLAATNATVVVNPLSMSIVPDSPLLAVNRTFNATVTLVQPAGASGVTVTLSAAPSGLVTISPASQTIAAGQSTAVFSVTAGATSGSLSLAATATGYITATAPLAVTGNLISFGTIPVLGPGQSASLPVSLSFAAPTGGLTINFTSSNSTVATVTPSVFVPAGLLIPSANPQVTGGAIGSAQINAAATGFAPDTASVSVTVTGTLNPSSISVNAQRSVNVTLTISAAAPAGGITFNLASDTTSVATVPATITVQPGQLTATFAVTGVTPGTANLNVSSPGITTIAAPINVGAAPLINLNAPIVGNNLIAQASFSLNVAPPTNPSNPTITLSSGDPTHFLLTGDPTKVGTASITLPLTAGSTSGPIFYIEGQNFSGSTAITATLSASAAGYADGTTPLTLYPTGLTYWPSTNGTLATTTFAAPSTLTAYLVLLSPGTLNAYNYGYNLGPQASGSVPVAITSSSTTVGTVTGSPSSIGIGTYFTQAISFVPAAVGTTNLTIAEPTGYFTPANVAVQLVTTVTSPPINVSIPVVGNNLVEQASITLGAPPPATPPSPTITLTSGDPTHFLLTADSTKVGTASITLPLTPGNTSVPTFYIEGQNYSGTTAISANLTVTSAGYATATTPMTLYPTGLTYWPSSSGILNTTTFSSPSAFTIYLVLLSPGTLNGYNYGYPLGPQAPGSVPVAVTSSATSVGTVTGSPSSIGLGTYFTQAISFVPAGAGTTNLNITEPTGYFTPSNVPVQMVTTVTAPALNLGAPVIGNNLIAQGSINLGATPPATPPNPTLTLTSSDPAHFLLTADATKVGSASITLPLTPGSSTVPAYYIEGQNFSGTTAITATLTASSAGYATGTFTMTLYPTGLTYWPSNGGTLGTTTFSAPSVLTAYLVLLSPGTLNASNYGYPLGPQAPSAVPVSVTSSSSSVGALTGSPSSIGVGTYFTQAISFVPATAGTTNLTIAEPTGYFTPSNVAVQIVATVTAPPITLNIPVIGNNMIAQGGTTLGAAPPSAETLTLTSSDPTHFLLTADPTKVGSAQIKLQLTAGSLIVPPFYIEGQNFSGAGAVTATLSASAAGYNDGTFTLTLYPTGLSYWPASGGTLSVNANSSPAVLTVYLVLLSPGTLNAYNYGFSLGPQAPGAVPVTVTSTNTAVGIISGSPASIGVGAYFTQAISFVPVATGTTDLPVTTPAGYFTPSNVAVDLVVTVQ
jgi:hypothetical protein